MARPTVALTDALVETARRLEAGATFKWSHFGNCICGNLAQTLTRLDAGSIHRAAFCGSGDWGQQALDYCPTSGLEIDIVFDRMRQVGISMRDVRHLERLSDPRVLRTIEAAQPLRHTVREDVVLYLRAWAKVLSVQLDTEAEHRAAA